jgi:CheY-like chemotaxis protein
MPTRTPTLVAVGPWEHAEFAALRAELDPQRQWTTFATLAELAAALADDAAENAAATIPSVPLPPELVLFAQARPGVDDPSPSERLRAVAPLTRVVVVAGSWCEGELRTGRPAAGVVRLYWYEFAPWWRAAVAEWEANETPAWSEPLDDVRAGQETAVVALRERDNVVPAERDVIVVDAVDFAVFETLAAVLAPFGWCCEWQPRHRPELAAVTALVAAIWDGGQLSDRELAALRAFAAGVHAANAAAPVIALLDFPRVEHLQAARDAGAAAVLGKPYQVARLVNELDRLIATGGEQT